jgi:hypothetical protein
MLEHRHLTTLWVSTASYGDSFTSAFKKMKLGTTYEIRVNEISASVGEYLFCSQLHALFSDVSRMNAYIRGVPGSTIHLLKQISMTCGIGCRILHKNLCVRFILGSYRRTISPVALLHNKSKLILKLYYKTFAHDMKYVCYPEFLFATI